MKTNYKFLILFIIAAALGIIIGWIDSRPNWDDTGITVAAILVVTALWGFLMPARAWIFALAVGVWIPLFNIILHNNYGSLIVLAFAFIGALFGSFISILLKKLK